MTIEEITVDDLADRLQAGATLIDVREPDEFEEARVPGAQLIPLATIADNIAAFIADATVYVVCKAGGRSLRACQLVAEHGARPVNIAGGTMAWIASGRAVESGPYDS